MKPKIVEGLCLNGLSFQLDDEFDVESGFFNAPETRGDVADVDAIVDSTAVDLAGT